MGYQIIEAATAGSYERKKYIVLNAELVIEMDGNENDLIKSVMIVGFHFLKPLMDPIVLNGIVLYNENDIRNVVGEPANARETGAINNPVINASGEEMFVRFSAFDNDRRVDKINKCLRAGSFTTTFYDYADCKKTNDNPLQRYALPNNDAIKFAFYILPKKTDTLQRGMVQPANEKRGGGIEAYFANGTATTTFIKQTPY